MNEQLPGKVAEIEAISHPATCDTEASGPRRRCVGPVRYDLSGFVKQGEPQGDPSGTIAGPIIRRFQEGMQRAGVAEQREIGRKVERVEIDAVVGQALLVD